MSGIDGFTKLMLHCNGTDASTTFTDDSASSHTVTANGVAEIDTAQKKFGSASGLFAGGGDRLSIPDSDDFDFGNGDFTVDFWIRFNNLTGAQALVSQWGGAGSNGSFYIVKKNSSDLLSFFYSTDGSSEVALDSTFSSFVVDTWYHIAVVRDTTTIRFFVDGVSAGIGSIGAVTINNSTRPLNVSTFGDGAGQAIDGWVDEVRISKGVARWISGFTPPITEYVQVITANPTILTLSSEIISPVIIPTDITVTPSILNLVSSLIPPNFPVVGSLIKKIISINPLIAVTDTSPTQIIKVDITDPENLDYTSVTIPNIDNAKDVSINTDNTYVYVAGSDGKVVKVEVADLTNQTTFDLSDTDDILTIEHNTNFGLTYAGTDNVVGELYTLDERSTFSMDSDFQALHPSIFKIDSDFYITDNFKMDSDFNVLSNQYFKMDSDFKCLTKEAIPITSIDDITPINLQDFQVFIDSVELEDTDLILESISITHTVGNDSRASFKLTRKHDQLNTTLEGVSSVITNQNTVEIKIKGVTEFDGKISELDCQYNKSEFVQVNALATEKTNTFNNVTMSLPGLDSRLSIYDILIQNPKISNPYVDPDNEDNPKKFKGIKVDLGKKIEQNISNFRISDTGQLSSIFGDSQVGIFATEITEGTFNPLPNWTYFWSPSVENVGGVVLGDIRGISFDYIGSSLAPVSEDLWRLINAHHWRQRTFDDTESGNIILQNPSPGYTTTTSTRVGSKRETVGSSYTTTVLYEYQTYYYVGEAPFKEISARNGSKETKPRYEDKESILASILDESYNYINYAKTVADLEYEKLKNINGNILPDTSCSFNLTTDAYLYYGISLLTRINIDNTTQSNIYNNANGFPVSVKSITISSSNRKVRLQADNIKSASELEIINSQFPDEDDDEYKQQSRQVTIAGKSNMRTRLLVE